ncbi:MAG: prepilin-type N-terminal cleavage/methylation domain-containing protein [Phycisphaerae bacterium]
MGRRGRNSGTPLSIGFTLLEVLVVTAVVAVSLGIVTLAFRRLGDTNRLALAEATITSAAAVARAYALENAIETMLVVNPQNGRLELWHAAPNLPGGGWDPLSSGDGTIANPTNVNGYVFANVLDSSLALPVDADGRSTVVAHPIDFDFDTGGTPLRATGATQANWDNLCWAAVCFDADGRLVQRTRRFATRLTADYTGAAVPFANTNRRADGTPDLFRLPAPIAAYTDAEKYVVDQRDTLVTSTRGFILSDRAKYEEVLATANPTPFDIVNVWLARARLYDRHVRRVLLSSWSGRELAVVQ